MQIKNYKEQIYNCGRCGYCVGGYIAHVCPSRFIAGFESATARGRMLVARALLEEKLRYSQGLAAMLFTCFLCGACDVKCSQAAKIKVTEITRAMRSDALNAGILLDKLIPGAKTLSVSRNIYGESQTKRKALPSNFSRRNAEADLIYFPGCVITFRYPQIAYNTLKILSHAGINFTFLGEEEWCCGNPFLFMGMLSEAREFASHNVERVKAKGVKTVLTSCAGCYKVLSMEYPKMLGELPFKVMHVTQFLNKLVDEGYIKLKRSSYAKVTYHDPCEIGRYAGIYEEPRNLIQSIPNLKLVEMEMNRENSWCCGGGGSANIVYTHLALSVSELRIRHAEETGAKTLVTACPSCVQMLELASKRKRSEIRVVDIASLIFDALKS